MVQIAEERPPYVQFEYRAVEDREGSIESGHYTSKDVAFVLITPAGSKDRVEREADVWFDYIKQQVEAERFPRAWYHAYKESFENWKKGNEPVLEGTDIRNWPVASPAQVKMMLAWNVRTVEDLAVANDETMRRLGMGGNALKEKAIQWLNSAKSQGKIAEQISALRAEISNLSHENKRLQEELEKVQKNSKSEDSKT